MSVEDVAYEYRSNALSKPLLPCRAEQKFCVEVPRHSYDSSIRLYALWVLPFCPAHHAQTGLENLIAITWTYCIFQVMSLRLLFSEISPAIFRYESI